MSKPTNPPPPRTEPGPECPVHHVATIVWPDGTTACPYSHATAKDIERDAARRQKGDK